MQSGKNCREAGIKICFNLAFMISRRLFFVNKKKAAFQPLLLLHKEPDMQVECGYGHAYQHNGDGPEHKAEKAYRMSFSLSHAGDDNIGRGPDECSVSAKAGA